MFLDIHYFRGVRFGLAFYVLSCMSVLAIAAEPISTARIESFPTKPAGYRLIDWRQRSMDYVRFALNPSLQGEYLPLMWWDDSQIEGRETTFGLPSYVGMKGQWKVFRNAHESFVTAGTLNSGTWLGFDMSAYPVPGSSTPVNLVRMQKAYFSNKNQVFSDSISGDEPTGQTFFYELSPSIFMAPLCDRYRQEKDLIDSWHRSCLTWSEVSKHLWRLNNYNFQSYDLQQKRAVVTDWTEPDVAAGLAYLMLMAYQSDPSERRFYEECHHALMWLDQHPKNINYGIFAPFGVYAAARSNAEYGSQYDVGKFFSWCFEASEVRGISPHAKSLSEGDDYGIISGKFGSVDIAGLVGASRIELLSNAKQSKGKGSYVFAMETFAHAWPLVAAVRYDERLARSTGKWMYHAAHSARWFYPDQLEPGMQTNWNWAEKYTTALPYEGLKDRNCDTGNPGPYGCGDPTIHGWGPSNLGLYSGCLSGVFGAVINPTSISNVLSLNLNVTDTFAPKSFSTRLLYNPNSTKVKVELKVEKGSYKVWDTVHDEMISELVDRETLSLEIDPDDAVVIVLVPADRHLQKSHGRLVAGDTIVDYSVK